MSLNLLESNSNLAWDMQMLISNLNLKESI